LEFLTRRSLSNFTLFLQLDRFWMFMIIYDRFVRVKRFPTKFISKYDHTISQMSINDYIRAKLMPAALLCPSFFL